MLPHQQTQVDVWTIALDENAPHVLSPEELDRAAKFHFERDRVRWGNARSALRSVLAEYLNVPPLAVPFAYGQNGKPSTAGEVHFNISHSDAWGMIAVTRAAPVGIDIERVRGNVDIAKLLLRIGEPELPGDTLELFRVWARREAKTKALGTPLMEIPKGDLRVVDLTAPAGFAAALALVGRDPRVHYRKFPGR